MADTDSFIPALHRPSSLLPIASHKDALLYTIERNPVTIVVGQTGSGKTTQLPQFLERAGYCNDDKPRRVAATTVAKRVAEEVQCEIGQKVGYSIRFEDVTSAATKIKFLTDGLLLREALVDPLLSRYSVIMVDEAHERSLSSDVLLGVLKKIRKRRPELRIVVSSATLQAEDFLNFFMGEESQDEDGEGEDTKTGEIISIEGRAFPVDIHFLTEPCEEYLEGAVKTVFDIHTSEPEGDILVFLTGRDEIEKAIEMVADRLPSLQANADRILPLPLYAGLTTEQQMYVFEPAPERHRKVIFATNIAEASVTIDGIVYVVDSGFVKLRAYNPTTGIETLTPTPTSQASATQRAGRAGRTKPAELIVRALELLYSLGALDDYAKLTQPLGTRMAEIALEPMLAACLLNSPSFDCTSEMLTIAAMTSLQGNVWFSHDSKKAEESARRKFAVEEGDHLTLLNVYQAFITAGRKDPKWCQQHFLNFKSLTRAVSIRNQLKRYLERFGIDVAESLSSSSETPVLRAGGALSRPKEESLRRCLTSGYFAHAARMAPDGTFRTVDGGTVLHAHPSSLMFNRKAEWVVFTEVMETGEKTFIRDVSKIEKGCYNYSRNDSDEYEPLESLPSNWHLAESGERHYYVDLDAQTTTWVRPVPSLAEGEEDFVAKLETDFGALREGELKAVERPDTPQGQYFYGLVANRAREAKVNWPRSQPCEATRETRCSIFVKGKPVPINGHSSADAIKILDSNWQRKEDCVCIIENINDGWIEALGVVHSFGMPPEFFVGQASAKERREVVQNASISSMDDIIERALSLERSLEKKKKDDTVKEIIGALWQTSLIVKKSVESWGLCGVSSKQLYRVASCVAEYEQILTRLKNEAKSTGGSAKTSGSDDMSVRKLRRQMRELEFLRHRRYFNLYVTYEYDEHIFAAYALQAPQGSFFKRSPCLDETPPASTSAATGPDDQNHGMAKQYTLDTQVSCIRVDKTLCLILVDPPPVTADLKPVRTGRSRIRLNFPHASAGNGLDVPDLLESENPSLFESLEVFARDAWHTEILCGEQRFPPTYEDHDAGRHVPEASNSKLFTAIEPQAFLLMLSSCLWKKNLQYLERKIYHFSSEKLPEASTMKQMNEINDVLHECRENLEILVSQVEHATMHMPPHLAAVREGHEGMRQTKLATWATVLAAVYLPLTLVTGIFGMNIKGDDGFGTGPAIGAFVGVVVFTILLGLLARWVYKSGIERDVVVPARIRDWWHTLDWRKARKALRDVEAAKKK
ncbi:hypothetical protein Q7P37_001426 [Cladosporium fusiforme]